MSSTTALTRQQLCMSLVPAQGTSHPLSTPALDDTAPSLELPVPAEAPPDRHWGCGWFDSSLDLSEGLTVREADDGPLQWALAQLLFRPARPLTTRT